MAEKGTKKTLIDRIWDLFSTVKLAIVIFVVIALTSIVGTLIEQNADPERNIKLLAKFFGEASAPTAYRIFDSLGFMDMYHSWWFVAILIVFAANLIICSIDKLPGIMRLVKDPIKPLSEEQLKRFNISREVTLKGGIEKNRDIIDSAVKKHIGFNMAEVSEGMGYQLFSQKGNYTRLGVYIVHLSIIIVLVGAVVGLFFGFKTFLPLSEGTATNTLEGKNKEAIPLGFSIRCDKFSIDYYDNTDMPKAYRSLLVILENGQPVKINGKEVQEIAVNKPLKYKGVTFYQSSYGIVPGSMGNGVFRVKATSKDNKTEEASLKIGGFFSIPGTNLTGKVEDFSPALALDEKTGKFFTYAEQMNNPAAYIAFYENGKPKYGGWVLKRYPETGKLPDGNTIELLDVWGIQFTGLQVRKDPGVWGVYLGCIIMAIGLFMAFFMSHRRVWIKVIEGKGNTRIRIGATANKNKEAWARKIERLSNFLSKAQEGGK